MASCSLRCVTIAYKPYKSDKVPVDEQQLTQWVIPQVDLVLHVIIGIKGPCCPEVRDVVRVCQNVGVKAHVESYINRLCGTKRKERQVVWKIEFY
jgi:Ca2+-transporting ATPase